MNTSELLSTLQQLQLELAKTETIDAGTKQALQSVMSDIQRVVDRSDSEQSAESGDDSETLSQKMMDAVNEFEARHPNVASLINNVADRLSDLGI